MTNGAARTRCAPGADADAMSVSAPMTDDRRFRRSRDPSMSENPFSAAVADNSAGSNKASHGSPRAAARAAIAVSLRAAIGAIVLQWLGVIEHDFRPGHPRDEFQRRRDRLTRQIGHDAEPLEEGRAIRLERRRPSDRRPGFAARKSIGAKVSEAGTASAGLLADARASSPVSQDGSNLELRPIRAVESP